MPKETNNKSGNFRLLLLCLAIIFAGIFIFARLYQVQVIESEKYRKKAEGQYFAPYSNLFERGSIYFTTKDGRPWSAASVKTGYIISINPNLVDDAEKIYEEINPILSLEKEEFLKKAIKENDSYEVLAMRISKEQAEKIQALKIKSIGVFKEQWRFYPGKSLASHLIGFLSYRGDDIVATYGLEREYDEVLTRKEESGMAKNFFIELFSEFENKFIKGERLEGSVIAGIEPSVQAFLDKEIDGARSKWNAAKVGGIVMDPKTGQIYAMSLAPSFDLNNFAEVSNASVYSNSIVEDAYELGSIIKPITMAIGIDTGAVTPNTTYLDKGSVTLDNRTFYNFDKKGRGVVSMQTVLDKSLNTGAAFVESKVGNAKFLEYLNNFFGEKTGIDLPNEGMPMIENLKSGRDIEFATASFGQGIALTPISAVRALASLANGGYLVRPHIVNKVEYQVGFSKEIAFADPIQVFKPETSLDVSRMLSKAFDTALVDGKYKMEHYTIAAKTGTAQIANKEAGGYYGDRYLHSFFGYFPAYNPKFIIFLYMVEPKNIDYASQTLADPFVNIVSFLINSYEIPPDR